MTRNRSVRKIGNSWFIKLEPTDIKDFDLKIGDKLNIEDCILLHNVRRKKKQRSTKSS